MFEALRPAVRVVRMGGVLAGALACSIGAAAQTSNPMPVHHRETNASREARIQRTIAETYSHRWEVFGGGGYLRFTPGPVLKKDNQVSWATSVHYALNPKLSIAADARGSFGNAKALTTTQFVQANNPQINEYFFMGGVDYRVYAKEKLSVSVEGLGGVGWGIFGGGSKGIPTGPLGLYDSSTKPAFSFGVPLDYNIYPNLAFRVTPTYIGTTFSSSSYSGGTFQNNVGFNMGIVYRFGKQ